MEKNAYLMTTSINDKLSVEEFDKMVKDLDYKLESGGRCGWNVLASAVHGSIDLMIHIIRWKPLMINIGNRFGWTPLFSVIRMSEEGEDVIYNKVKFLLANGADPSLGSLSWCGDSQHGNTGQGTLPIESARARGLVKVVQLLEKWPYSHFYIV
jgi:hypothetical protein